VLQHETLLKLIYTNLARTDELRTHIAAVAADTTAQAQVLAEAYFDGHERGSRFLERAHLDAIAYEWLTRILEATAEWADWARDAVDEWPTPTTAGDQQTRWTQSTYEHAATRLTALTPTDHTPN
jgi:hypothetical protein